ncbi:NmrA family transcriptional regulator [Altererythrobacter sp. B11]|uniref:NmrA family NAD(P)-binding protein n=1 Tax=Altererythrobacter sp. B11 TaxID=2060312 RepID=UPI000DC6DB57|nr:NAD(P)H-binding protein [Altererythrobacter sp. B11]BBC74015.1 NmrA family transcriptional regulator [Altererythrobacter sp. B11]
MIVVTAPTSQIGQQLVTDLLAVDAPLRVVARDPAKLADDVRNRVEIIEGSHGDAEVAERAFAGAEAIFWLAPPAWGQTLEQAYLDFTRPAAAAIRRHGVARVVSITALGRGTRWQDCAGPVTASIAMDDMLMETGAAFRGLAMPSFMENTARQIGLMKDRGAFFGPIDPEKKLPFTATRDMATAAARLLHGDHWEDQADVPVLGPDDLSFNDQAAIISEVTGRSVRYEQISYDRFKQQFLDRGASESVAQGYVDMYRAKEKGIDNVATRRAEHTGATSFRDFCRRAIEPGLR